MHTRAAPTAHVRFAGEAACKFALTQMSEPLIRGGSNEQHCKGAADGPADGAYERANARSMGMDRAQRLYEYDVTAVQLRLGIALTFERPKQGRVVDCAPSTEIKYRQNRVRWTETGDSGGIELQRDSHALPTSTRASSR
jgi:hypothetical protein